MPALASGKKPKRWPCVANRPGRFKHASGTRIAPLTLKTSEGRNTQAIWPLSVGGRAKTLAQ